jgi:hypothetical protein
MAIVGLDSGHAGGSLYGAMSIAGGDATRVARSPKLQKNCTVKVDGFASP